MIGSRRSRSTTPPTPVVLAKPAQPGAAKTRLIGPLSAEQAAAVHAAMLDCVLNRVATHLSGPRWLALAGLSAEAAAPVVDAAALAHEQGWSIMDQGEGDLGRRLDHVWRQREADAEAGGVAFLGVDSPDVPAAALTAIDEALAETDVAVGPAADGGYWTLAARAYQPALLTGIEWGGEQVYARTRAAAEDAGLTFAPLPAWYDVDEMADLRALRQRLETASEPALVRLRNRLDTLCGTTL